jgi:hypothetical protein
MTDEAQPSPDHLDLGEVHLIGLPVPLWGRAQQQGDELVRELTLIASQVHDHHRPTSVPVRLVELVDALTARYGTFSAEQEARLAAAAARGEAEIDELVFRVPPEAGVAAADLWAMLDEVDDYCRGGQHLLMLATPPDLVRFRQWYLDEFIRQLAGQPPRAWSDYPG